MKRRMHEEDSARHACPGMIFIVADVMRFISDEPQPGIVECVFSDAFWRMHAFVEKAAIVGDDAMLATTVYPVACELACGIVAEWEEAGEPLVRVCTERPWHIVSVDGETNFVVRPSQLRRAL